MKKISLLGATGSIGTQTLDLLRLHPEEFQVVALSFGKNLSLGVGIIKEFKPKIVSVLTKDDKEKLEGMISSDTKIVYGEQGLVEVAVHHESSILVNAVIGSVGLIPTLEAINQGKTIALANKETLVTAGHLVMSLAKEKNVEILPVDSEHSAIFQSMVGQDIARVKRLILTASGGSFRDRSREELNGVTVGQALSHPNWSMGAKITIDSATMMNKGLEVIEARWLFDIPYKNIEVILHKESIIHSMVEYDDTSVIAQLGSPDMRVPIQYALTFPKRLPLPISKSLNLWEIGSLNFQKIDLERFRCLRFAYEAGTAGGTFPTVLNAANEVAVDAFLNGKITFLQIEDLIDQSLEQHESISNPDLETIKAVDMEARRYVTSLLT
ncbi:1-deoxy-D-xylulose-5-phosphate reductoisomerase [Bacillus suaedaesalsae]|uniref:1-deoxy-D-xylulose 5-phosphate reductoisomerase n=1 Tax=Bacillus suaedaesalsae TaxID=2810349 RepID=A0ABS2DIT3_9BACI|nr:1-deoxy-D-xylulose-5-phosphate reductoisomerase [Bacillus suaedaesalsae]MBM6618410.1 1-deoxy-D-xylulose-5-phosphate reductoisomerase [Bacillus suaedaesalsae]